ncbi:hypothetical protein SAMN06298216_1184 [Spirosomataceae bacterium TFI 002]|nr:hypothetical protein SAMN06298216_1184 [Spirosomataceae bacterium TFI 002]
MLKALVFAIFLTPFISCTNELKDEKRGLHVTYNGLEPKAIELFADQVPKESKTISFGQELTVHFKGIDDFSTTGEKKVLFGGEVSVIDSANNVLFHVPDYFKKYDLNGVDQKDAETIKLNLIIGKPLLPGNTFRYLFRIWDKKSDKELKGNLEFEVI